MLIPDTEKYYWQAGIDTETGEEYLYTQFFTAHNIYDNKETLEFISQGKTNPINYQKIFEDTKEAFEIVTGEKFDMALKREDVENRKRMSSGNKEYEIPF